MWLASITQDIRPFEHLKRVNFLLFQPILQGHVLYDKYAPNKCKLICPENKKGLESALFLIKMQWAVSSSLSLA
jgi:hypothetical protein